jgi:hypothetical protein
MPTGANLDKGETNGKPKLPSQTDLLEYDIGYQIAQTE